ncbi:MAG: hypothetical protein AAFQ94_29900 [Bacteroidota bacterium]
MKKNTIMNLSAILIMLLSFFACSDDELSKVEQLKSDLENLSGTYQDINPYAYGDAFGQRIFTFDKGKWTLVFTLALDPNLENQVFQFRTYGSYRIGEASEIVENAFNAEFGEDKKFVTLKTDNEQLIEAFGFSSCGLTPFIEKDISENGCSLWKPVSECPVDHDLVSLDENGLLYFGQRPADNDMCSADKRPTSLTPAVSKI